MNIVILAAGLGARFKNMGFSFPKPLIEVPIPGTNRTGPMIEMVVRNLNMQGKYIFVVLKEHYDNFSLRYLLNLIVKNNECEIVIVNEPTQGALCSALLTKDHINNDEPLLMANCDQYLDWEPNHFLQFVKNNNCDGAIITFVGTHSKWSFCKVNELGLVEEVREKQPISTTANTGVFFWKHGKDFVSAAEEMIEANDKFGNEYYVSPSYNYLINRGLKIYNYPIPMLLGTGIPEDLQRFTNIMNERNKS